MAGISARGKTLAAYDDAAWHASDALQTIPPTPDSTLPGTAAWYVVRYDQTGWQVAFGRLTAASDTLFVYGVADRAIDASAFVARALKPPRPDTGYYLRGARAAGLAMKDFGPVTRPYNVTAIPIPTGDWWVYIYPAPTQVGVWPYGGDQRDRVSSDGRTILERRRLHRSILEYPGEPASETKTLAAHNHSAVLDDVPEDTDVFAVLQRTPKVPEYIVTRSFIYRIDVDGSFHFWPKQ